MYCMAFVLDRESFSVRDVFCVISPSSGRHACMSGHLMGKYSEQLCCELCDITNRVEALFPYSIVISPSSGRAVTRQHLPKSVLRKKKDQGFYKEASMVLYARRWCP